MGWTTRSQREDYETCATLALEYAGCQVSTRFCQGFARKMGFYPTFDQMNGALTRLWQAGEIRRITQGHYRYLWAELENSK